MIILNKIIETYYKMNKLTLFLAIFGYILDRCESVAIVNKNERLDWWQTGVLYQIYPRSFKDSNGDGTGDLRGIAQKADYLRFIGVSAVWLNPIFESPLIDSGYDISNYTRIDPDFGTLEDFEYLKNVLHDKGIRILLDFVPNHSSDQHEWFKKSVKKIAPYTDYYVWKNPTIINNKRVPPNNWRSQFGGSAWYWNEERQQYYLRQFHYKQPDLNYNCKELVQEMKNVIRFWLDRGIDGFRMDAVTYMFEDPDLRNEALLSEHGDPENYWSYNHTKTMDQPDTYRMLTQFREIMDSYTKKDGNTRVMLTEAYTNLPSTMQYYEFEGKQAAHMPFNFLYITAINGHSPAKEYDRIINMWMNEMPAGHWPNWVISNHDNPRLATRYGTDLVDGLNMMGLLLPGTGITYYGDEIGMEDTHVRYDEGFDPQACELGPEKYPLVTRDPERSPFQWDNSINAGFSASMRTWLPINSNYWRLNLKAQLESKGNSHIKVYRSLMNLRKSRTIQEGHLETHVVSKWVFSFVRYLNGSETYVIVINLGSETAVVDLSGFVLFNLPEKLRIHTGSINSRYMPGDVVFTDREFFMRPKASLVLTTGEPPKPDFDKSSADSVRLTLPLIIISLFLYLRTLF